MTALAWLAMLKLTGHPLMQEVSSTAGRVLARFRPAR